MRGGRLPRDVIVPKGSRADARGVLFDFANSFRGQIYGVEETVRPQTSRGAAPARRGEKTAVRRTAHRGAAV